MSKSKQLGSNMKTTTEGSRKDNGSKISLNAKLIFLLSLVSLITYANTFKNSFALDDNSVITRNTIVTKGIVAIPEILSTPYRLGFYTASNDLYRPLSLVMFAVEYQLFAGEAMPMHVINVLIFIGCVILVFLFFDRFFNSKKTIVAFITALLFALHPIHTEVVANIKGRDELLCFFFAFVSLNVFARYIQQGKIYQLVIALFSFLLALLSKETAICLLVIIPFVFFIYLNENKKRSLLITFCIMAVGAVYLPMRFLVLNKYHAGNINEIAFIDNMLVKAPASQSGSATAILILGKYFKLLVIPYPLICDYSFSSIPFTSFNNVWVILSLLVYTGLAFAGFYRLVKFRKDPYAFGILFFLISLALFSNLVFLVGTVMGERFLFFASVGFCLIAALLMEKWLPGNSSDIQAYLKNAKFLFIMIPLSVIYIIIAINRNEEWKDDFTLYRADIKKQPDDARLYYFLGNALLISTSQQDGDAATQRVAVRHAIDTFRKALTIYPEYVDVQKAMGEACFFCSEFDSAVLHFKKAIEINPLDVQALNNLDVVYFNNQRYEASIGVCYTILKVSPHSAERYNNIALCYMRLAKYDSAISALKKGIKIKTDFSAFYQNIALAYKMDNQADSAIKYQNLARQFDPGFNVF